MMCRTAPWRHRRRAETVLDATPYRGRTNLTTTSDCPSPEVPSAVGPTRSPFRMRNIPLAARMLLKTPFVTAIAILSLALGIGANAAIFSMFDQLLLHPLDVNDPSRLVNLKATGPMQGSNSCNQSGQCDEVFSYAMFRDLEKSPGPFTAVAAH